MNRFRIFFVVAVLAVTFRMLTSCGDGSEQRLLLEELERHNRADSLMTNDSLALSLAYWFDRHGTSNEQMRAHYILGRTYADLGETSQAILSYQDAIDRADTTARDCDYYTLCRVYSQMAVLFFCARFSCFLLLEAKKQGENARFRSVYSGKREVFVFCLLSLS